MISLLSTPRAGGGATVLYQGDPRTGIAWTLSGPGALTRAASETNEAGVATAYFDATGVTAGAEITISVEVFP